MKRSPAASMIKRAYAILFAVCCAVFALGSSVTAASKNVLFEARYEAEYTGIDIDITRTLTVIDDNKFSYGLVADGGIATIREYSVFSIGESNLRPLDYNYRRKIMGFGGKEELNFDWKNQQAVYVKNGKKKKRHTLKVPIYDPALYQLQLQLDLYVRNQQSSKSDFAEPKLKYRYMHKKKLRNREFKVVGKNTFNLQGNQYEALVLERVSLDPNKTTTIWVLPELYYQIAYIRQIEDGESQETSMVGFKADHERLTKFYSDATLPSSPNNQKLGTPTP